MIELDDVRRAAERLAGVAHRTPVVRSRGLDERTGATVALKPENLQRVGAFKFRGAYHAIVRLMSSQPFRMFAAVSSGNHGQGFALACHLQGAPHIS